MTSVVAFHTG